MMVAHNPLHRSQRAGLPHWALTSGDDAKAPEGVGVTNARRGQPAVEQPLHPLPGDTARVTAPRERTLPEPRHLVAKHDMLSLVHGHPVIAEVPTNDQTQPSAHLRDRVVQAPPEFGFHLAQLRLHPLPARLPNHREPPIPFLPADVREAEEIERLPASPPRRAAGARPRSDRTPAAASSRGAAPDQTSQIARAARPGTARPPPGAEIPR